MILPDLNKCNIAIIGLGYVGLPLAVELSKVKKSLISNEILDRKIIGFDINLSRIEELKKGIDKTKEISSEDLANATNLTLNSDKSSLQEADVFIITVPTPINKNKNPDLEALIKASQLVGLSIKSRNLRFKDKGIKNTCVVIYESTVYPGLTEEICIPIIEEYSDEKLDSCQNGYGFVCGYSPERINPGDKLHNLINIKKVTSGSNDKAADWINNLYRSIIVAGTFKATSIKVAEAAKIIENTQRDLNIALINELAMIFNKLGISTNDVLEAANTKWNFLPFRPGLVGGHCIGVDPYYLTHKSEQIGYHPQLLLAGRKINDEMGKYVANEVIKLIIKKRLNPVEANILILGLSFKPNCPDLRNTKTLDIIDTLCDYGINIDIYDPCVDKDEALRKYGFKLITKPSINRYSAIIVTVSHEEFINLDDYIILSWLKTGGLVFEIMPILSKINTQYSI